MKQEIYFRGGIDFCNYACSYCPFAKQQDKRQIRAKLSREKQKLTELYQQLAASEQRIDLLIVPYGEAFSLDLYQQFILAVTKLPRVDRIGIQSNLSLNVDQFLAYARAEQGELSKVMIWASYHREFAQLNEFSAKVNALATKLHICAGMVADVDNIDEIKALRAKLKPYLYLWLNPMAQRKNSFSADYIRELCNIDPMFAYSFYAFRQGEWVQGKPAFQQCGSYQRQFITGFKNDNQCFFKNKHLLGKTCNNHKYCDCYLGYSQFKDSKMTHFFGDQQMFRLPTKHKFKALFIDFDGVMTTGEHKLIANLELILQGLVEKADLYLATARSIGSVQAQLKEKFSLFKGGVFSDGCLIMDKTQNELYLEEIELNTDQIQDSFALLSTVKKEGLLQQDFAKVSAHHFRLDGYQDKVLRMTLPRNLAKQIKPDAWQQLCKTELRERHYGNRTFLQSHKASKRKGIVELLALNQWQPKDVLIISDNIEDRELFVHFPYTVSPLAATSLREISYYDLNLDQLLLIVE